MFYVFKCSQSLAFSILLSSLISYLDFSGLLLLFPLFRNMTDFLEVFNLPVPPQAIKMDLLQISFLFQNLPTFGKLQRHQVVILKIFPKISNCYLWENQCVRNSLLHIEAEMNRFINNNTGI